jgi:hypothetical protein
MKLNPMEDADADYLHIIISSDNDEAS